MPISQMGLNKITDTADTICAISTAPGTGGIAVIRISGSQAIQCANRIWKGKQLEKANSHTAHLGYIINPETTEPIDQCVATVFHAPGTFTGEDIVELSVHGSQWIQQEIIRQLINGKQCRLAEPGEFTRRAFANGKIDLSQAEAVADVIASTTQASHRLAMSQMRGEYSNQIESLRNSLLELASLLELELDFSEEDVEFASREKLKQIANKTQQTIQQMTDTFTVGKAIKEGIPVAIIGEPNTGKSTLLNNIVGDNRAIVSDIPGTTRDTIEDTTIIHGIQYRFIDTAGLRNTSDVVESLGIERSINTLKKATVAIWLITAQTTQTQANQMAQIIEQNIHPDTKLIICINKTDINKTQTPPTLNINKQYTTLPISALTGQGIDRLKSKLHELTINNNLPQPHMIVTNARHYEALCNANESIKNVLQGLEATLSGDFIAQDVRQTIHHLGEITGTITTPDILATIFSRFCVGK